MRFASMCTTSLIGISLLVHLPAGAALKDRFEHLIRGHYCADYMSQCCRPKSAWWLGDKPTFTCGRKHFGPILSPLTKRPAIYIPGQDMWMTVLTDPADMLRCCVHGQANGGLGPVKNRRHGCSIQIGSFEESDRTVSYRDEDGKLATGSCSDAWIRMLMTVETILRKPVVQWTADEWAAAGGGN